MPVGVAVPLAPEAPHEARDPSVFSAAKPVPEDQISTKPVPVGALVPPVAVAPHTAMLPSFLSAA